MPRKRAKKHSSTFWFEGDIKGVAKENVFFRKAVYTGEYSQLMLMSIPEGGESGEEKRKGADTILFVVKGRAKSILNGRVREVGKHDVLFVPAGNVHNVSNAGKDELKLIVIYSPALYPEGTAYKTREEETDVATKALEGAWEQ